MRKISTLASILLLCLAFPLASADASVVTFTTTGSGGAFDFDAPTGQFIDPSGLIANFSAIVAGNPGPNTLNATGTSLGINAGGGGDDTDQLDSVNGLESIQIVFSGNVSATLTQIDIVGFAGADMGTLDISGAGTNAISSGTSTIIPTHSEIVGNTLTIAQTSPDGNGFGIESLTFHVKAIPEPTSLALIGLLGLGVVTRRRR